MQSKLLCALFFLLPSFLFAQEANNDEKSGINNIWNIEIKGAYDVPFADMATRFGNSFKIGAGISYKTNKNWTWGLQHQFIVGGKVKEPGLLQNLYDDKGGIVSYFGELLNPGIFQRGYMTGVEVGKILPYLNTNPNSGLTVQTGIGFMQYKINLFDRDNSLAPLRKIPDTDLDYKKGYDRLTNGMFIKQFVGYTHYSTNKLINYRVGIEGLVGFTQGRRAFLFDVMKPGDEARIDGLVGVTFTWMIPIYKKITEDTYY